ncbi:MAG: AmmeMemoRadiSam system radical SAM enzyme [Actinobacteria bacterium RBG_16_64_13]|nr:MAG: AmmeMemoRadiSam system radical SAM enzyme [Actinobacteria bacterium RBG_16_64_13]
MAQALFWEEAAGGKVRCTLCPHLCLVGENEEGLCRARGVRNGCMVGLTYARPVTIISDEIEKKPLFHFHPGTRALSLGCYGCNVLCTGCQNWQISHASARTETSRLPELTPAQAVAMARKHKLSGVAFTYNDPAVWIEYVHDVCAAFKEAGLYTAFITAGYLTEPALDYVGEVVDAFKFDLKGATAEQWARLTKVKDPTPAYESAVRAKERHGCHVEVVSNIVPGLNDDEASLQAMARWVREHLGPGTPWHVTRFMPDFELSYLPPTSIKTLERAVRIGKDAGLRFVYVGNVQGHAARHTVCPGCGRTVMRRGEPKVECSGVERGLCAACGEDLGLVEAED